MSVITMLDIDSKGLKVPYKHLLRLVVLTR